MEVSQATKNKYINGNITKNLVVQFSGLFQPTFTVEGENIYADSMSLSEQLFDNESIEFVGCIASKFEVSIRDLGYDVKGANVYAYMYTGDDPNDRSDAIPLFHGVVDSVKMESNHRIKHIIAYDELYTKGNKDVSAWYKGLNFGTKGLTLGEIRRSLLQTMGLSYVDRTLPNDNIKVKRQYKPSSLQAIAVLKSLCQINGVFGMIGRDANFKFISIPDIVEMQGAYPGPTLFPPFYPGTYSTGESGKTPEAVAYYKSLDYQEYSVKPVQMVIVRQDSEDDGGSFSIGDNKYIVQGNMFTLGLKASGKNSLDTIAENLYNFVKGFSYIPYSSTNNGFPWLECGETAIDCMVYDFNNSTEQTDIYAEKKFFMLNREMSGIQNLKDTYSSKGDEYQREFISDIGVNIDVIRKNLEQYVDNSIKEYNDYVGDNYYNKDTIDDMMGQLHGWSVESVTTLPPSGKDEVLYLIQGEVVVE